MGSNTASNLLSADGTNFKSVAVGSLSEISTVANDDVFLAVDTSGGEDYENDAKVKEGCFVTSIDLFFDVVDLSSNQN